MVSALLILAPLALLARPAAAARKTVSVRNDQPRLDSRGAIVDGHDLSLRALPNGSYVMHTIEYGLCVAPASYGCDQTGDKCGFRDNHNVTVWLSDDLTSGSWRKVGNAFDLAARPPGLIYRPDAILNPTSGLWVLWYDWVLDGFGQDLYVTSTSPSPFGPFSGFAVSNCTNATWQGGDFHIFIDPNSPGAADGYVVWTGMSSMPGLDHKIRISKLTPDFLNVTDDEPYMFMDEQFNEAPAVFWHYELKKWYALFGHCCCFCEQGSGLFVYTADHPMGPWTHQAPLGDIACQAPPAAYGAGGSAGGIPTPGQGCLYGGSTDVSVTRAQQDFLATLPDGAGGHTYLEIGSRWGQSPDGLKGHEPQYWTPLEFAADGTISHIVWQDEVSFDLDVAPVEAVLAH